MSSLTFQFFFAFLRKIPKLRRLLKRLEASAEIQRFEFATFGKLLGIPTIQLIHGEGSRDQPMDSLLKNYWFTHRLNEKLALRLATRIIGVNPRIVQRITDEFPFAAGKTQMMTVSVNTDVFALAASFPPTEPFRIGFAGRLDAFKRPDIMFKVLAELDRRLHGGLEFHYVGGSDPTTFEEFEAIRHIVVRHGSKTAREVAGILSQMHAGILVSDFEGMPVYVLELLSVGRPLVVLDLPQLGLVIEAGVSGIIVPRSETIDENSVKLADAFVSLKALIEAGKFDPAAIRSKILPFSHNVQQTKLFDLHRSLTHA